jgi:hypothetical protein
MSLVMHLRAGAENAPRLFDNLYPFKRKRGSKWTEANADEDAVAGGGGGGYAQRQRQREQQRQKQLQRAKKAVRNRREHFVQHQHLLLRLVRAAPAAPLHGRTSSRPDKRAKRSGADEDDCSADASLWEAAARLLSTPFALESSDVRPLGDVSVRVGLELVRNTQPARGAHQLMLHLGHAYIIHVRVLVCVCVSCVSCVHHEIWSGHRVSLPSSRI